MRNSVFLLKDRRTKHLSIESSSIWKELNSPQNLTGEVACRSCSAFLRRDRQKARFVYLFSASTLPNSLGGATQADSHYFFMRMSKILGVSALNVISSRV